MAGKQRQREIDEAIDAQERDDRAAFRERLNELRALLASIDPRALDLTPGRWARVREWLMAVEAYADRRGTAEANAGRLAATAGLSDRQARTCRGLAISLGLVETVRRYGPEGRRSMDGLAIRREALDELAAASREQRASGAAGGCKVAAAWLQPGCKVAAHKRRYLNLKPNTPPPPPPAPRALDPAAAWERVGVELFDLGLNAAAEAVERLQRAGATPEDVRPLLDWWRPRVAAWRFPEAVLFRRLCRWKPGQAPDRHWPPFSPGWVDPDAVERARRQRALADAAAEQQRQARIAEAAAERDRLAQLESRYGAAVDELDRDACVELLASDAAADQRGEAMAFWSRRLAGQAGPPWGGVAREKLLERLAEQAGDVGASCCFS